MGQRSTSFSIRSVLGVATLVAAVVGTVAAIRVAVPVGLVIGLVVGVLVVSAANLGLNLAGYHIDAEAIAARLVNGNLERALVVRWVRRTAWARYCGGFIGIIVWLVGPASDPLLSGVLGLTIGSILSQLHNVRPVPGPRAALLQTRGVSNYLHPRWRTAQLVGIGAVGSEIVAALVLAATGRNLTAAIVLGSAGAALGAAVLLVQRRVATRPRPLLSVDLNRADDLARQLAIGRGLAAPAAISMLALAAHGWLAIGEQGSETLKLIGYGLWLVAAWYWLGNRRLGLDDLERS